MSTTKFSSFHHNAYTTIKTATATVCSLGPNGTLLVHFCALTLTGLVVRAIDPMRSLLFAVRGHPQLINSPNGVNEELFVNNALLMGLNASFLGGVLADRCLVILPPKVYSLLGYAVWAIGWLGLIQEDHFLVYVGAICLGLSFSSILNALLYVTAVRRKSSPVRLSLLSISADVSTCVPLILSKVTSSQAFAIPGDVKNSLRVRNLIIGYVCLFTTISVVSTLLCTSNKHPELGDNNNDDNYFSTATASAAVQHNDTNIYPTEGDSVASAYGSLPSITCSIGFLSETNSNGHRVVAHSHNRSEYGSTSNVAETSAKSSGDCSGWIDKHNSPLSISGVNSNTLGKRNLPDDLFDRFDFPHMKPKPLSHKLTHPLFILFAVFFCFNIMRMSFLLCWTRAILNQVNSARSDAAKSVNTTMDIYNVLAVFSFIPGVVWGRLSQCIGIMQTNLMLNGFGLASTLAITLSPVWVQRIGVICFVVYQSFVFSDMYCFLTNIFGFSHLKRLQDVLVSVSVLVNLGLVLIGRYAVNHVGGNWIFVSRALTLIGILTFPLLIAMVKLRLKKSKLRRREDKRGLAV